MADSEKFEDLIEILGGEEKVNELYRKYGSEKISFASVKNFIKVRKIKLFLKQKKSIAEIASKSSVSKMTVYRLLKKFTKHKKK